MYNVVDIDLEYTRAHAGSRPKVAVAQVCVRDEVLIYHFCRAIRGSGAFARFIGSADCTFATVERRKNAMNRPSGATSLSTSRSNT